MKDELNKLIDAIPDDRLLEMSGILATIQTKPRAYWNTPAGQRRLKRLLLAQVGPNLAAAQAALQVGAQMAFPETSSEDALGSPESVPALLAAFDKEHGSDVRVSIVQALSLIGTKEAIDGLASRFESERLPEIREAISRACGDVPATPPPVLCPTVDPLASLHKLASALKAAILTSVASVRDQAALGYASTSKGNRQFLEADEIIATLEIRADGSAIVTARTANPALKDRALAVTFKKKPGPFLVLKEQNSGAISGRVHIPSECLPFDLPTEASLVEFDLKVVAIQTERQNEEP